MRSWNQNLHKQMIAILLAGLLLASLPFLQACGIAAANMELPTETDDLLKTEADKSEAETSAADSAAETESQDEVDLKSEEQAVFPSELAMYYDDRLDMNGKKVEIVDAGSPDSFLVGYGVEAGTPDEAVVLLDGDTLIAVGTGTAQIKVEDIVCDVTVSAAPISLFLLAGQSNMEGLEANPEQSVVCPAGQVYASYGDVSILNRYTAKHLAPSALTGENSTINVVGTTEFLCEYPINALVENGNGKSGPDSGMAYEWVKTTGEKIWLVNAAHSGASMNTLQKYCNNYEAMQFLFAACQETLKNEIAAGHYKLSHMGMFWCQGCADGNQAASWYVDKFLKMYDSLKIDLSIDMDGDPNTPDNTLEFVNIIMAMAGFEKKQGYRMGTDRPDTEGYYMTYKELEMKGHRVGQYWLAANPEYPDIHVVCNLGDSWMTMPDGSDGVAEYFESHYTNGIVDYTTHVEQSPEWYQPTKSTDVKHNVHYNQIGFNELGIDAARNTCILLGYLDDTDEETTVRFVDWTGYRDVTLVKPSTYGLSGTLVVPLVSPVYRSKEVTYQVTEGLKYDYYDLLTSNYNVKTGTLSTNEMDGITVSVSAD